MVGQPNVPRLGLNRAEVALALGVSPNTVDAMVADGSLPPARRWHKRMFWRIAEIDAAMAEWPIDGADPNGAPAPDDDEWRAEA
jgi:predicted DNA-binding transcriptional regulator AlpA